MEKQTHTTNDIILELKSIHKSFSKVPVLKGIDLQAKKGEFITLLGSSGCGKTTTLRIISGLEAPDAGQILLEGQDMTDIEPNKRNVNTVFQSYALFPHMNVAANIGYSLKVRKRPKAEIQQRVSEMLTLVQLEGYEKRKPAELSGGQRQRVAIARAVISHPKILLLDEPLGALDLQLRRQMQTELKGLQKKLGITFIYITHDQEEAINMSDRIAVMDNGRFLQIGTPAEIYDAPRTSYVARFVGGANIVKGRIKKLQDGIASFENESGTGAFVCDRPYPENTSVTLAVRGEHARIEPLPDTQAPMGLSGVVQEKRFVGGMLHISVLLRNGDRFVCNRQGFDSDLQEGDCVFVSWPPTAAVHVDREEDTHGVSYGESR